MAQVALMLMKVSIWASSLTSRADTNCAALLVFFEWSEII
jgi:hypothetical protein